MVERILKIGILTISDRAAQGKYVDRSGPAIQQYLETNLATPFQSLPRLTDDDPAHLQQTLLQLVDDLACDWVLTSGGTGPAPRDNTPEVTTAICQKMLPGYGEQMRRASLENVPTAILSRQTAGIRNGCLIVNLPGSPKAISECLDAILVTIPHCLRLLGAPEPALSRLATPPAPH